jgi:CDGSH-type Zn-finger protein
MTVRVLENGPYLVAGSVPLAVQSIAPDANGDSVAWTEGRRFEDQERYALCRCGQSGNKPYCDGTHKTAGFDGTETADRRPYLEQAVEYDGPELALTDAKGLCAGARFCHPAAGRAWDLVREESPEAAELLKREEALCPSGRLVAWDRRTRTAFEPALEPSIGIVEDPQLGVSGPLWVRGGITVQAADGFVYEVRNRVTLCRCGQSRNKPFCDAFHARIGFDDGLLSRPG